MTLEVADVDDHEKPLSAIRRARQNSHCRREPLAHPPRASTARGGVPSGLGSTASSSGDSNTLPLNWG